MRQRGSCIWDVWIYFIVLTAVIAVPRVSAAQEPVADPHPSAAPPETAAPPPAAEPQSAPVAAPETVTTSKDAATDKAQPDAATTPGVAPEGAAAGDKDADQTHAAVDPFFKPVPPRSLKTKKVKKEKPPKTIHTTIEHGVLTVDGWTGKANINFDIDDFQYFYMWAPGVGTVIVSNHPFLNAKVQNGAFNKNTLTVKIDDHQLQFTADGRILPGKPKEPVAPAYVALDTEYAPVTASRYPVFGYGTTTKAPYAWPGSLVDTKANKNAPPLPSEVAPTLQTQTVCQKAPAATPGGTAVSTCKSVPVPLAPGKKKQEKTDVM